METSMPSSQNPRPQSADALQIRQAAEEAASSFPALLTEAEKLAHTMSAGLHGRRKAGPGETFWQHRPYTFGDPVSAIDWRQSARTPERLHVRQNEWESAASIWFWLDGSKSMDFCSEYSTVTKRRRADIIAVALSILLTQAGEKVGLMGQKATAFHGRNGPSKFLETLTISSLQDTSSIPPVHSVKSNSRTIFISDFYTEYDVIEASIIQQIGSTSKGLLIQIIDPLEEDFPFTDRVEFSDMESTEKILIGRANAIADDYRRSFRNHQEKLKKLCQKISWTFVQHRTDDDASDALQAAFLALEGR